jgi:regulator of replication initiation timing
VTKAANMQSATDSLTNALDRLQKVVADDEARDTISALENEVKELRAQCAVLIKENAELNASNEGSKATMSELESQQNVVTVQLDNAIVQLQDMLKAS